MSVHEHAYAHSCECEGEHHHSHDCNCDCHHTDAENIIESALIVSRKGMLRLDNSATTAEAALSFAVQEMTRIASTLAIDNDVLGHIKALLECTAGNTSISITRVDKPDVNRYDGWDGDLEITEAMLSINILSLANTGVPAAEMLEQLVTGNE